MKKLLAFLLSLVMVSSLFTGFAFATEPPAFQATMLSVSVQGTVALTQVAHITATVRTFPAGSLFPPAFDKVQLQRRASATESWTEVGSRSLAETRTSPQTFEFTHLFDLAGEYRIAVVNSAGAVVNSTGGTTGTLLVHNIGTIAVGALTVTPTVSSVIWDFENKVVVPLTVVKAGETTPLNAITANQVTVRYGAVAVPAENISVTATTVTITQPSNTPATGTLAIVVAIESGNWSGTATVAVDARSAFNAALTVNKTVAVNDALVFTVRAFNAGGHGPGAAAPHTFSYFRATLSGPFTAPGAIVGTDTTTRDFASVTPRHGGTVTATVVFYDAAHNVLQTLTREITVPGVRIEVPVTTVRRNDETTLRVIVTDLAGNRVNNALVSFVGAADMFATRNAAGVFTNQSGDTVTVNGMSATQPRGSAVANGEYSIDVRLRAVGSIRVTVSLPGIVDGGLVWTHNRANWAGAITVAPTLGYTIALDHTLLAGATVNEDVSVTVRDTAGAAVTLDNLAFTGTGVTLGTPVLIGNGAWRVPMRRTGAAGSFTLTVRNEAGTIEGTASVTAVAPVVTVTPAGGSLTANFYSAITVTVTDPRTNVPVERVITVAARQETTPDGTPRNTATVDNIQHRAVATPAPDWTGSGTSVERTASAQQFNILSRSAALSVAGVTQVPNVRVTVAGAPAVDLGIAAAQLVVTPAQLVSGRTAPVTVQVNDANGVAMVRPVIFEGLVTGTHPMPAAGTLTVNVQPTIPTLGVVTPPIVTIAVQPDRAAAARLTHEIPVVVAPVTPADTARPTIEVTAPSITTDATAMLTIVARDNVAVTGMIFDGSAVSVFPAASVTVLRTVALREGLNSFMLAVVDAAGNVTERIIVIERRLPAPVKHTITIGRANPAIGLDVPANVRNGRLMVPFRWFGEQVIGATVNYQVVGAAEIVTLHKGNTHIELTLNSTIAKVNGTPVSLDVAAYATGGRTLVPARFVAETFGYTVDWNAITDEVTFTKK